MRWYLHVWARQVKEYKRKVNKKITKTPFCVIIVDFNKIFANLDMILIAHSLMKWIMEVDNKWILYIWESSNFSLSYLRRITTPYFSLSYKYWHSYVLRCLLDSKDNLSVSTLIAYVIYNYVLSCFICSYKSLFNDHLELKWRIL